MQSREAGYFGLRREAKRHAAFGGGWRAKAVSPLRSATAVQNARLDPAVRLASPVGSRTDRRQAGFGQVALMIELPVIEFDNAVGDVKIFVVV